MPQTTQGCDVSDSYSETLYQEKWRSCSQKEVDVWFTLSTGKFWPHSAFEPLLIGTSFPPRGTRPWLPSMKRDKVVALGRTLSEGIICANYGMTCGLSLGQCDDEAWCAECFTPSQLDPCDIALPEDFMGATNEELEDQDRFMRARTSDHLCTSFQCPNCSMGMTWNQQSVSLMPVLRVWLFRHS